MRGALGRVVMGLGILGVLVAFGWPASGQVPTVSTDTSWLTDTTAVADATLLDDTTSLLTDTTLAPLDPTIATTVSTVASTVSTVVSTVSTTVDSTLSTVTSVVGGALPVATTLPGEVDTETVIDCTDFLTQQAAQLALTADPSLADVLDADTDGLACEMLPRLPVSPTGPAGDDPVVSNSGGTGGSGTDRATSSASGSSDSGGSAAGSTTGLTGRGGAAAGGGPSRPGAQSVTSERPLDGAQTTAAGGLLPADDEGARYVLLKVIAFAMLLGVTGAAAANRELLVADLFTLRN